MRIRAGSAPGSVSESTRRRPLVVGLLLGLVAGFALAISLPDSFEPALGAVLRDPATALRGWRLRRQLPSLQISIDFDSYQRWMRVAAAQQAEGFVATEPDCAAVQLSGGDRTLAGTLCPTVVGLLRSKTPSYPAFTLEVTADATWLGARRVMLAPADPSSALGVGYLRMLAEEGLSIPFRQFLDLSVNGSGWGVYVLEAAPVVSADVVGVLVTFDGADLQRKSQVAPERSFVYARAAFTPSAGSDGADADPELVARAAGLFSAWESGAVLPSGAVDPQALGRMVAATVLWHGVGSLDWQTLALVFDPATGRFAPLPVGWAPDPATPFPWSFLNDPEVQRAVAVWLDRYADPGVVDAALAHGDLDALYVMLGGAPGGLRAALLDHQTAMRGTVTPSRTLYASMSEERGVIRIDLRAVMPFPVELLRLDFDGQGTVTVDSAWLQEGGAALAGIDGTRVVLAARASEEPATASLTVPLSALPVGLRVGQGTLLLVTRVWGLEASIPVVVEIAPAWSLP